MGRRPAAAAAAVGGARERSRYAKQRANYPRRSLVLLYVQCLGRCSVVSRNASVVAAASQQASERADHVTDSGIERQLKFEYTEQ